MSITIQETPQGVGAGFAMYVLCCLLGNQMLEESFVEDFSEQVESAIRAILCTIQNLAERNSKKAEDSAADKRLQEEDGMSGSCAKINFRFVPSGSLTN